MPSDPGQQEAQEPGKGRFFFERITNPMSSTTYLIMDSKTGKEYLVIYGNGVVGIGE